MAEYKLPDVGEGLTEAEIVSWKVKVGDEVRINDIVVEIETAKSLVELPSPYAGTVGALLVEEGETVPVGTPIIAIGDADAAPAEDAPAAPADAGARWRSTSPTPLRPVAARARAWSVATRPTAGPLRRAAQGRRLAALGGRRRDPDAGAGGASLPAAPSRRTCVDADEPSVPAAAERAAQPAGEAEPGTVQVLAKPPVRKLAKDLGVDLRTLTPTGPNGTISRDDVQGARGSARG